MLTLKSEDCHAQTEPRQSSRYRLREGTMAIGATLLGPILNLSLHGMSFEYYADDLENSKLDDVGIFVSKSKMLLTGLQIRVIRDHVIDNTSSFLPVIRKSRAVEFINPSSEQLRQIRQIIATQGIAPP